MVSRLKTPTLLMSLFLSSRLLAVSPYLKTISLPCVNCSGVRIVFGNPTYGYFETEPISIQKSSLNVKFFPPGYRIPVRFYAKRGDQLTWLASRRFPNPTPKNFTPKLEINGKLSPTFYLLNAYVPFSDPDKPHPESRSLVFMLNSLGEVVWMHQPAAVPPIPEVRTRSLVVKPVGEHLGILRGYHQTYFELIDWDGNVILSLDPQHSKASFPLHHDFVFEDGTLLAPGFSVHWSKKPWRPFAKPASFLSTPLLRIDTLANKATVVWNYLQNKNPHSDPDWTWNARDSKSFWVHWDGKTAQNNFMHLNSIQKIPSRGYLVSLRNLNRLLLLDSELKQIHWSVGPDSTNTFSTKHSRAEFFGQHHATLLENGNILLFDNGRTQSRIIELYLDSPNRSANLVREFKPTSPLHCTKHGSAFLLKNGNVLGFFPNSSYRDAGPNHVIEFDARTGAELGRLTYDLGYNGAGYRAEPIASLCFAKRVDFHSLKVGK